MRFRVSHTGHTCGFAKRVWSVGGGASATPVSAAKTPDIKCNDVFPLVSVIKNARSIASGELPRGAEVVHESLRASRVLP